MKTLILSNFSDKIADLNAVTAPNKQAYADRHGYEFVNMRRDYCALTHIEWIEAVKTMITGQGAFDIVMTVGCDVLFMNMEIEIDPPESSPITLAKEHLRWWPINNDVMIWRRCPETLKVLDRLIKDAPIWLEYKWLWQLHLWNLMQTCPEIDQAIDVREAKEMNATVQPGLGQWQLGDWILHLLDIPNDQKVGLAKDYLRLAGNGTYYPPK